MLAQWSSWAKGVEGAHISTEVLRGIARRFWGGEEAADFTSLEGNYPNPFNPTTTILFNLAADTHVNLAVYDISGRLMNKLVDGPLAAGEHEIVWNGKNQDGVRVASGVYFYKLNADDYSATKKMVMVK